MEYMRKEIPEFEGYCVDNGGNVWSRRPKNGAGSLVEEYRELKRMKKAYVTYE